MTESNEWKMVKQLHRLRSRADIAGSKSGIQPRDVVPRQRPRASTLGQGRRLTTAHNEDAPLAARLDKTHRPTAEANARLDTHSSCSSSTTPRCDATTLIVPGNHSTARITMMYTSYMPRCVSSPPMSMTSLVCNQHTICRYSALTN